MEHKKKIEKHVEEQTVVSHYTCDLCGKNTDHCDAYWRSTFVEVRASQSCDGDYSSVEFDLCYDCFRNELEKWFKSKGVSPREKY